MKEARILIVEDVELMLHLLERVVAGLPGFRVVALAKNAWEARLEISRRRPDLILLDEVLPGESSLDLLREFNTLGIPTFLLTGMESPTHAVPPGALGRLKKPAWESEKADRERFGAHLTAALTDA